LRIDQGIWFQVSDFSKKLKRERFSFETQPFKLSIEEKVNFLDLCVIPRNLTPET